MWEWGTLCSRLRHTEGRNHPLLKSLYPTLLLVRTPRLGNFPSSVAKMPKRFANWISGKNWPATRVGRRCAFCNSLSWPMEMLKHNEKSPSNVYTAGNQNSTYWLRFPGAASSASFCALISQLFIFLSSSLGLFSKTWLILISKMKCEWFPCQVLRTCLEHKKARWNFKGSERKNVRTGEHKYFFPSHSVCKYLLGSNQVPVILLGIRNGVRFWAIG